MQIHHKNRNANHNVSSNGREYLNVFLRWHFITSHSYALEAMLKWPNMVAWIR